MNIIQAIQDENIFRSFFGDLRTWKYHAVVLRALYGLPIKKPASQDFLKRITGREASEIPPEGFTTACLLTGRRSGKSRISAVIAAYEALFCEHETRLAKGEVGIIPVISPTRYQSTVIWRYLNALFNIPLLKNEVAARQERNAFIQLKNGLEIRVATGDWRTIRGFSVVCGLLDEACFFGLTEESKVRSDTELVRALRPALITTGGKLIAISSKYARKGWMHSQWQRQHGSNKGKSSQFRQTWRTLVIDAASSVMNPTLPQSEIDAAYEEDAASARSEFGNEWRDDVQDFISRDIVEDLVVKGRKELLPRSNIKYHAGCDLSGGRNDDSALVIWHREERKVIIDKLCCYAAPHSPYTVIGKMCEELKPFKLSRITGDNYSAEFSASAFRNHGVKFLRSEKPKSALYLELLPVLCSHEIELLDDQKTVDQISNLERRTRSGGKDSIDHPKGAKDDCANVIAIAASKSGVKKTVGARRIGPAFNLASELAGQYA